MTLSVTNYGDNPFIPGESAQSYTPDQLIAGDLKLVTASATITGAAAYQRGTVMGQITVGAAGAAVAGANTGNGAISAISRGGKTKVGTYTIHFTGATTYDVLNPAGVLIGKGYAAGAYTDAELNFTFTAGGTPMVAGDTFTIPIAAGSGSYTESVATAVDGSQNPAAILVDNIDVTAGDLNGGLYLMGEFNGNALTFDGSWTLATLTPPLRALSLFIKTAVSAADPS
jgi:hypothetical protein